jgi:hypothetical protein
MFAKETVRDWAAVICLGAAAFGMAGCHRPDPVTVGNDVPAPVRPVDSQKSSVGITCTGGIGIRLGDSSLGMDLASGSISVMP